MKGGGVMRVGGRLSECVCVRGGRGGAPLYPLAIRIRGERSMLQPCMQGGGTSVPSGHPHEGGQEHATAMHAGGRGTPVPSGHPQEGGKEHATAMHAGLLCMDVCAWPGAVWRSICLCRLLLPAW